MPEIGSVNNLFNVRNVQIDMQQFIVSFLICSVNEDNEDHPPPQVNPHEQAVRNTVNRLIELYHPAPPSTAS